MQREHFIDAIRTLVRRDCARAEHFPIAGKAVADQLESGCQRRHRAPHSQSTGADHASDDDGAVGRLSGGDASVSAQPIATTDGETPKASVQAHELKVSNGTVMLKFTLVSAVLGVCSPDMVAAGGARGSFADDLGAEIRIVDPGGKIQARDLKFSVVDIGGKTGNLQVRETAAEIRNGLAADVLFDFDKATIKPEAARF